MKIEKKLYVIVHNVRSAHNVGAIFRTADGLGVEGMYLTGYTPAPYRENEAPYSTDAQKRMSKTALGAEKFVPWEKRVDIFSLISDLKKQGFQIISLELAPESVDIRKFQPDFQCALIVGTETTGIDNAILAASDAVVSIPMRGRKESFNVSVAAGIAMYEILK
ncbi:MAG: RNA methyltransferase [Candidatus Pacebacteria bacterium]|nr:RNA methyltransferase [Candidatus Paceibacterota bacterium]MDR3582917.1 RNA methyltransferase [Candidatus Paceibacterota bacterium]